MKRRDVLSGVIALALPLEALAVETDRLAANVHDLTRELTTAVEIPEAAAIATTGSLLHIAKRQLPILEFADVTRFLPGTIPLMQDAARVVKSGLPGSVGEMLPIMNRLGLPAETTIRCQEFIVNYLRDRNGRKIAGLLKSAWRS